MDVKVIPDIFELILLKSHVEELDGIPIVDVSHTPLTGWPSLVKRVIDIAGSMVALVLFSPIMLLIALLIKSTSKGPVFFRQQRMGLDGKPFSMLKFRTMHQDAEKHTGPIFSSPGDPRKTRFGHFLRKSSLDELPQLFNVLRGDMSLVGPRPERPTFVEQFKRTIPQYMLRHKVKAGMTGWAQVNGWRGDTSIKKRIEFDIFYIENWSFSFDFKILWLTLTKGSFHKNAY